MTSKAALADEKEVGKESSPGCATCSVEPEGFKRKLPCSHGVMHFGQGLQDVTTTLWRVIPEDIMVMMLLIRARVDASDGHIPRLSSEDSIARLPCRLAVMYWNVSIWSIRSL